MKKHFLFCTCLLFFSMQLLSQKVQYFHAYSARLLMETAKGKEKFYAMRSLDRYYYTTGLYDSSALLQKQMYALAKELKSDSIMYLMFRAIGNRFTAKRIKEIMKIQNQNNGSTSSSARSKEKFQRIFFRILNDISRGNTWLYCREYS